MTFDHRELLQFAKDMERVTPPVHVEGSLRAGVSRAYYFAFLESREQAKNRGVFKKVPKRINHQPLIDALRASKDAVMQKLGHKLETFKVDRETADYDLNAQVQLADLQGAIDRAEEIDRLWQSFP